MFEKIAFPVFSFPSLYLLANEVIHRSPLLHPPWLPDRISDVFSNFQVVMLFHQGNFLDLLDMFRAVRTLPRWPIWRFHRAYSFVA